MSLPSTQHQVEIQRNRAAWQAKPHLRAIYAGFYQRIQRLIDPCVAGRVVEIGSGVGNLKEHLPSALATDLFLNPWLDLTCDAYELPFATASVSHLILFDVFHHLERPLAFLGSARRVLSPRGAVILFEPYISVCSFPAYGWFHPEPVAWRQRIHVESQPPTQRPYYAAQGNATRLFFGADCRELLREWDVVNAEAFASFRYLLSGGFSRRALYPAGWAQKLGRVDEGLSRWPRLFGARCVVRLRPKR